MSKMAKESVDDPEFSWWYEALDIVRLQINYGSGYTSTATSLTVNSGGLALVPGDVLQVEKSESSTYDNELIEVSSVTSDTVIVVKRGVAGSTPAAISDDTYLTKVANAFQEGSSSPSVALRNPTKVRNYCEIFKTAVGITETARKTRARTGDAWVNDKKRKMFDHSRDLELAFLFGRPYEDTSGTYPKRYTGGLRYFIQTNSTIFSTTPTMDTFLNAVAPVFDFEGNGAGDERIVFCGNGFLTSLAKLARDASATRINFQGFIDNAYGMRLQRWVLPQGTLGLRTHPLLNRHSKYTYSAFIIDPTVLKYRPLRDTKFQDNIQTRDSDTRKGQWLTEAGLEVQFEKTCAYIGNFVV